MWVDFGQRYHCQIVAKKMNEMMAIFVVHGVVAIENNALHSYRFSLKWTKGQMSCSDLL